MTSDDAAHVMLDLLERERELLLDGRVAELDRIAPEKERIAQNLQGLRNPGLIAKLRHEAQRNAAIIDSAAKGVRAAIGRVQDIRNQAGRLNTYTPEGKRASHQMVSGTLERRA